MLVIDSCGATGVGVISGQVVRDQGGEPVVGADVTLLLPPPPSQDYYVWPLPLRQAQSDAEGKFAFFSREKIKGLPIPETDKAALWPIFDQYKDGFVSLRADCSTSPIQIMVEQITGSTKMQ